MNQSRMSWEHVDGQCNYIIDSTELKEDQPHMTGQGGTLRIKTSSRLPHWKSHRRIRFSQGNTLEIFSGLNISNGSDLYVHRARLPCPKLKVEVPVRSIL